MTLVERLRDWHSGQPFSEPPTRLMTEAAEAIEKAQRLAEAAEAFVEASGWRRITLTNEPLALRDALDAYQNERNSTVTEVCARCLAEHPTGDRCAKPVPYSADHYAHLPETKCGPDCLNYGQQNPMTTKDAPNDVRTGDR